MIDALATLAPYLRKRLQSALESGRLKLPCTEASLSATTALGEQLREVCEALNKTSAQGASETVIAAFLRGIEQSTIGIHAPDLVWTGPEVPGLNARDTLRVYEQLMRSAERSLWISSFVYFDQLTVFEILAQRMREIPSLRVVLLLNIERKRGDTSSEDNLVRRFADRFWGAGWTRECTPQVYYDPRSIELEEQASVLHAKAVVADDEDVFITSANLTDSALHRNIELGILLRDRALALAVSSHFQGLIDLGHLRPLPER